MSDHYPLQAMPAPYYPQQATPYQYQHDVSLLLTAAKTGAIVGATGAAAVNLHRLRKGEANWQQLVANTAKVGLSAGVATAAATAVGRMFVRHPMLSLAASVATGTAVMYALNGNKEHANDE